MMQIVSAVFTSDYKCASVTMDSGEVCFVDTTLPPDEQFRRMLADWLAAGGEIAPYQPPLIDLIAYAADRRWRNEVRGISVAGIPVATDDRAKLMITGARVAAMADPSWSTTWHGADGNTYPVDAAAIIAISDQVQQHVNTGFTTFAAVKAEIDAGTITTTDQIDVAFGA
ncbi:hypothetical protein GGC47_003186 [Bosea sp. OAE752]|uniref:DUF4376 domain-containing protein n=1 Tax=Bosea sp. OAE752 TaxID=2663873 RepID=UPI003D246A8B